MNYNFYSLIIIGFVIITSSCSQKVSTDESYDRVELPDGSVVLLNNHSSIEFDKNFEPRIIELTGEAYFKVTTSEKPFIVKTDLGEVKVLGTKFNVNSTEDELEVEVESGKVELTVGNEKKQLSRGQQAKYNKGNNSIELGKAKLKFKIWLRELDVEFKKLGKDIEKESKKIGKELDKEGKKLNKKLKQLN